jgi:hypothetical protein
MPVYPETTHTDTPKDVVLERWSIRETSGGTRHFVGWNIVECEGRVSTAIREFDGETRTGSTASGSTYRLVGRAGNDKDAEYMWGLAQQAWSISEWRDVTAELVPDWRQGLLPTKHDDDEEHHEG